MRKQLFLAGILFSASLTLCSEERVLNFDTAMQRVYAHSPAIIAASIGTDLSSARTDQASVFPNPELEIDVDKFGDSRRARFFDSEEITYSITQLIELGGKRGARINLAELAETSAELELEQVRFEMRQNLIIAFVNTYAAQEHVKLTQQKMEESEKVWNSVKGKVDAGKVPITQQHKAEIAMIKSKRDFEHESHHLISSKYQLAALWGDGTCLDFDSVAYPFYSLTPPPKFDYLCDQLADNAELAVLDQEIAIAQENICLQRANRIPDILVNAGVVNIRDTNDYAGTFGVVIPLPVFDRNQGNIDISHYELMLAQGRRDALMHELQTNLHLALQEWTCSYHEAVSLRDTVLNKASESYSFIKEGYIQGKYEFLELLDAQRTLIDIQEEYINSLIQYHLQKAEVERLLGKCL